METRKLTEQEIASLRYQIEAVRTYVSARTVKDDYNADGILNLTDIALLLFGHIAAREKKNAQ